MEKNLAESYEKKFDKNAGNAAEMSQTETERKAKGIGRRKRRAGEGCRCCEGGAPRKEERDNVSGLDERVREG